MKRAYPLTPRMAAAGLALALTVSGVSAANPSADAPAPPRSYPLKTCVVDGKKLKTADKTYALAREGQGIKLCSQDCLPVFEQRASRYLAKVRQAAARTTANSEPVARIPAALDATPGGLAWAGW